MAGPFAGACTVTFVAGENTPRLHLFAGTMALGLHTVRLAVAVIVSAKNFWAGWLAGPNHSNR